MHSTVGAHRQASSAASPKTSMVWLLKRDSFQYLWYTCTRTAAAAAVSAANLLAQIAALPSASGPGTAAAAAATASPAGEAALAPGAPSAGYGKPDSDHMVREYTCPRTRFPIRKL
jgi:hypothetical protein